MLKEQLERSLLMGIGLFSLTREKAQAVVEELVKQGEVARGEINETTERLVKRGEEERGAFRKLVREEIEGALNSMHLATESEITALREQLSAVQQQLETLTESAGE